MLNIEKIWLTNYSIWHNFSLVIPSKVEGSQMLLKWKMLPFNLLNKPNPRFFDCTAFRSEWHNHKSFYVMLSVVLRSRNISNLTYDNETFYFTNKHSSRFLDKLEMTRYKLGMKLVVSSWANTGSPQNKLFVGWREKSQTLAYAKNDTFQFAKQP